MSKQGREWEDGVGGTFEIRTCVFVTIVGMAHSVSVTGTTAEVNGSPNSTDAAAFSHAVNVRSP